MSLPVPSTTPIDWQTFTENEAAQRVGFVHSSHIPVLRLQEKLFLLARQRSGVGEDAEACWLILAERRLDHLASRIKDLQHDYEILERSRGASLREATTANERTVAVMNKTRWLLRQLETFLGDES